jgi:hypothetical protein
MNRPPMLMHLRFQNADRRFGLWIPLFLFAPFLLSFLLVLSPFIFIALLVFWEDRWGKWFLQTVWTSLVSLFSLRGLEVDVQNESRCFYIAVK